MQGEIEIGSLTLSLEELGLDEPRAHRIVRLLGERLELRLGRAGRSLRIDHLNLRVELDPTSSDDQLADAIARALAREVVR